MRRQYRPRNYIQQDMSPEPKEFPPKQTLEKNNSVIKTSHQRKTSHKQFSQLQQTIDPSLSLSECIEKNSPQSQEINIQKNAVITENVPFALPVQKISKVYLTANVVLNVLYLALITVTSTTLTLEPSNKSALAVIIVACIVLISYILYILAMIKYSVIKVFALGINSLKKFQLIFQQLQKAKTYFRITIQGDREKINDPSQFKELVYEPEVEDRSGKLYSLPKIINYCNQKEKLDPKSFDADDLTFDIAEEANHRNNISLVITNYRKKYFFKTQNGKMNYLNAIQEFFKVNNTLFSSSKHFKGYKKHEFIIQSFSQQQAFMLINSQRSNKQISPPNENYHNDKSSTKSQFQANNSQAIVILEDNEFKAPEIQPKKGLIYRRRNEEGLKENQIQNDIQNSNYNDMDEQVERKYIFLFNCMYWTSLILGFGAFYELIVIKYYVKRIQVNITKQIN